MATTRKTDDGIGVVRRPLWEPTAFSARQVHELAADESSAVGADWFFAELRETNRRRPRLQREFDRAGLP